MKTVEEIVRPQFGDYIDIEQKRHGADNEMFTYKVIGSLNSNTYVPVPVQTPEKQAKHDDIVPVVRAICTGVDETQVSKFRIEDVKPLTP